MDCSDVPVSTYFTVLAGKLIQSKYISSTETTMDGGKLLLCVTITTYWGVFRENQRKKTQIVPSHDYNDCPSLPHFGGHTSDLPPQESLTRTGNLCCSAQSSNAELRL